MAQSYGLLVLNSKEWRSKAEILGNDMQRQQKFLGNVNIFRQPKLFWIMSHVTYLIACSALEIATDQRVTECIPMMTRRKHIHDARWIKVHFFGSGSLPLEQNLKAAGTASPK